MFKVVMLILALASSVRCQGKQTREELMREFQRLDVDRDGYLSIEELFEKFTRTSAFSLLYFHDNDKDGRISPQEWLELNAEDADYKIFDKFYDRDGDGRVDEDDLWRELTNITEMELEYRLEEAFKNADDNENLKMEQFKNYLKMTLENDEINLDLVCKRVDKNGDGLISWREFLKYMSDYLTEENEEFINHYFKYSQFK